jgi:hypothetical protein
MPNEALSLNEVKKTDRLVRKYATPPGDYLYAYRDDKSHVVVSNGSKPHKQWTKREPATVTNPIPGQKLWTIPENWDKQVHSKGTNIDYAIYSIPESKMYAKVSIPTNDWLVDAWYGVKTVGELDAEPVGDLGPRYEAREFTDRYKSRFDDDESKEMIDKVVENWDVMETELQHATEWVRSEGLEQQTGDYITTEDSFTINFRMRIYRPEEALNRTIDDTDETVVSKLVRELRDEELIPNFYEFRLVIRDCEEMKHYIRGLTEAGASPAEALDYYMVSINDMSQTEWAGERGVNQSTVSENVNKAVSKIDKH